jgi:hypothetical protein
LLLACAVFAGAAKADDSSRKWAILALERIGP